MHHPVAWLVRPKVQLRLWVAQTLTWIALTPVSMLTGLKNSVAWVSFLSLYALIASCGTAAVAALAYVRAESADRKADHVIDYSPHLPEYGQEGA